MNLSYLKQKLVWQMTGEELSELIKYELQNGTQNLNSSPQSASKSIEQKYIYGLKGIAKLFGCSVSSARRLKQSGKINDAIIQEGRKIIVEVDKALQLVKNHKIERR